MQSGDAPPPGAAEGSDGSDDAPLLAPAGMQATLATRLASFVTAESATNASWFVNVFLLIVKTVIFITSNSKAVLASLADSAVDLASQGMLSLAERYIKRRDARYPVGRARLEALGVLGCAMLMSMAAVEVIQFSASDLWRGFHGDIPKLALGPGMYASLLVGIFLKLALWFLCRAAGAKQQSDLLAALAEDHMNDVWSKYVLRAKVVRCVQCTDAKTYHPRQRCGCHHWLDSGSLGGGVVGRSRRRHRYQRCYHRTLERHHSRADEEDRRAHSATGVHRPRQRHRSRALTAAGARLHTRVSLR